MARVRFVAAAASALLVPAAFAFLVPGTIVAQVGRAFPTVETQPVSAAGDAADDVAIWIHPLDTSLSTIIGTNKRGGLAVYDLSGREIQHLSQGAPNNVDLRYNFPLGGERVSLVVFSQKDQGLGVYAVDPASRSLFDVAARPIRPGIKSYGLCLYHSPTSDRYYVFVTDREGALEQWELLDDGRGKVRGVWVRTFEVGSQTEGCVADDLHGALYAAEESVGIWRYGAEPGDGAARRRVDSIGSGGHLTADVEGLTTYNGAQGAGYLIASSQGADSFVVYERGRENAYVATFQIVEGGAIDGVSATDGIDVASVPLGAAFPEGVFVAHDGSNSGGNQNFKLVPWGSIARAVTPNLKVDTSWDPRQTGRTRRANHPPSVSAGPNATSMLGSSILLEGSVSDDGLPEPPRAVVTTWSQVKGPGVVTFGDPGARSTRASFSRPGLYALRLTADDGDLSGIDDVMVEVGDPPSKRLGLHATLARAEGPGRRPRHANLQGDDLDRADDDIRRTVALRFTDLDIPRNARILTAYVAFEPDEEITRTRSLTIHAQAVDDAPALAKAAGSSLQPLTVAGVDWSPAAGTGRVAAGQRTPDLASVIQEIICRPGWKPGNAVVLVVTVTGSPGVAASDGERTEAPPLHVEYRRRPASRGTRAGADS